jgi:hypothetical protein
MQEFKGETQTYGLSGVLRILPYFLIRKMQTKESIL